MLFRIKQTAFKFYHEYTTSIFQDINEYYEYYNEDGSVLKKYMWEAKTFTKNDILLKLDEKDSDIEKIIYFKVLHKNEIFWLPNFDTEEV